MHAKRLLSIIVSEHPDHIEALYRLGTLAHGKGDTQSAMTYWSTALNRAGWGRVDAIGNCCCRLDLGAAHEDSGGVKAAHAIYLKAMDRLPGEVELLLRAGAAESRLHLDERAIAHYEEAMRLQGSSTMLHNNRKSPIPAQREVGRGLAPLSAPRGIDTR